MAEKAGVKMGRLANCPWYEIERRTIICAVIDEYQKEKLQGRHSVRLRDYDYSQPGVYFVTICTREREPLLGQIVSDVVVLTDIGQVVSESWIWLGIQYQYVELDQ